MMSLWSQELQRRGGFSRSNVGPSLQQSARMRGDFDSDDFLFERRRVNQLPDPDFDLSPNNLNMGRSNWRDDDRRGMNRSMDMPQNSNFNKNMNWMDDEPIGMSRWMDDEPRGMRSMMSENAMSQNNNRMWMGGERRGMSRSMQSDNSMNQNNYNRRLWDDDDCGGMNPMMDQPRSMNQKNFNRGGMRTGNERRGTKRPIENNYANNLNRDMSRPDDKRSRQVENKTPVIDKQNIIWETKWNKMYPEFRVPGNYKQIVKWEKCLQPQNAIQIYNQIIKGGFEIPCKQVPREERDDEEPVPARFIAHATLNGKTYEGTGMSKKSAQQSAAENALKSVFKLMLKNAKITKDTGIIEIDRNDLVPWNYITSLALYKLLAELNSADPKNTSAAANHQKSKDVTPPEKLPPNAVELNPYRLLLKMKPGVSITRISDPKDPNVEFEVVIDGKRFTGSGKLPQEARRAVAKNTLSGLYGIVYPEEKPVEPLKPGEIPKNAVHWNPYKLMLRMKPDAVVNCINEEFEDEYDDNLIIDSDETIKLEVEIDGQKFTEIGKTMTEARTALGKVVCQTLYGIVYPQRQKHDAEKTEEGEEKDKETKNE